LFHDVSLYSLWRNDDRTVHDGVSAAAVFSTDVVVGSGLVKLDGQLGDLTGENHEVRIGILDLETMLYIR
jgi:hypothetical protein